MKVQREALVMTLDAKKREIIRERVRAINHRNVEARREMQKEISRQKANIAKLEKQLSKPRRPAKEAHAIAELSSEVGRYYNSRWGSPSDGAVVDAIDRLIALLNMSGEEQVAVQKHSTLFKILFEAGVL